MKNISFVLDHKLNSYRAPLFDDLSRFFNVTVFHRGPELEGSYDFSQRVLAYKKLGPFEYVKGMDAFGCNDAVVFMQNLRVLNIYTAPLFAKGSSLLFWGIGTSSTRGLGSESWLSIQVRNLVTLAYHGLALYSDFPFENYWKANQKKILVVGNSVVSEGVDASGYGKEHFLFIGSLNKRKGIDELVMSFNEAAQSNKDLKLVIVGGGPEKNRVQQMIRDYALEDNVRMLGPIYDAELKADLFKKAFCVISPQQAGLSVVEAFSYGVPFVTSLKAITGGESLSIIGEENGVLFDDPSELSDIILSFCDGRRSSARLGRRAYSLYADELAFELYARRFNDFIKKHI